MKTITFTDNHERARNEPERTALVLDEDKLILFLSECICGHLTTYYVLKNQIKIL